MNDKKAKLLRKSVYGDMDYRERVYETLKSGQIINKEIPLRSVYQRTKRLYNEKHKA